MKSPSEFIDREIANHPDWRGRTLAEVRRVIHEAVPDVTEEWKWMGTPTWSHNGILCICNAFKDMVKVTFINGAKLEDVDGVFNAELGGNKWRAIKHFEGDTVNASGLKKLLLAAVALNGAKGKGKPKAAKSGAAATAKPPAVRAKPAKAAAKTSKGTTAAAKAKRPPAAATKSKR
jgi:hypothetical protein